MGIDGVGQIPPMDQIFTDCVSPVRARIIRRKGLIEQMPLAVPIAQPIRIVERAFRTDEVVQRAIRLVGHALSRMLKTGQQRIGGELLLLFG